MARSAGPILQERGEFQGGTFDKYNTPLLLYGMGAGFGGIRTDQGGGLMRITPVRHYISFLDGP